MSRKDVTVIVPTAAAAVTKAAAEAATAVAVATATVEPYGEYFVEYIRSIHVNGPAEIIIVTAGSGNYDKAVRSIGIYSLLRYVVKATLHETIG